jgi:hypothetical protein
MISTRATLGSARFSRAGDGSRHRELPFELKSQEEIVSARTLKPTRETRALPNPLLARVL